ncbi:S-adenosyl-L-methionine-dependent tRNA 4-demethylwyosine synthase [Exophiala dermatitidis]
MDLGEGGAAPVILADWLDRSLTVWHDHRVVVTALVVLSILTLWVRRRRRLAQARPSSPALEKADPSSSTTTTTTSEKANSAKSSNNDTATAFTRTASPSKKPDQGRKSTRPTAARVVTGRKPTGTKAGARGLKAERATLQREQAEPCQIQPLVFFTSLTGTTERLAKDVVAALEAFSESEAQSQTVLKPQVHDLSYIDLDDYFITGPKSPVPQANIRYFYLLLLPSYDIDTILNTFLAHLDETHNDFRIDTSPLSTLAGYTVFGVGDKEGWPDENRGFCAQAIEVDRWMAKLTGGKRAYPLGLGDVKRNLDGALKDWLAGVRNVLEELAATGNLGEGVRGSGDALESADEEEEDEIDDVDDDTAEVQVQEEVDFPDSGRNKRRKIAATSTVDLEDVGGKGTASTLAVDFTTYSPAAGTQSSGLLKAMVPKESPTHAALTKQGYTIVGTHSGVKICRWTKSALRGRGSCYKNSFYGIASHLCMETTPSLSCSNKCVFCWRHGTNPVSTTWRWQVDDPVEIFNGAKEGHYKKIKMMRGVPGVRSERFAEAMRIRHCALSLVGEPIFYPRINEFVGLLHSEHISSFLVCNAQHPQQLRDLHRVTQLYVSIDASNRDSLRKIDRPLHRDFWERFQACLDILREKRFVQRTVFRLTLVKGFNVDDEVEGYAELVARGLPCFIEVKGVTYCGTSVSANAGLTMGNVPFYDEVVEFVNALDRALAKRGLEYGIAAEHAHSCCVLLASNRFRINGKWHTVIDYDRFFELLDKGVDFRPEDYCKETAEWALWGNGGFDPRDVRVDRKGRPKE